MPTSDDEQRQQRAELEARVGHPGDLWQSLLDRVQDTAVVRFSAVQDEWLALMWSIDQYRVEGIPPRDMGTPTVAAQARLEAVYRSKGNWFKTLLSLLLQNQTDQQIKPRTKVQGFSQSHQIDLAWPSRGTDPLVYAGTRVSGAPAFGSTRARSPLPDFTNRRKELKFAATDLKLYRGQEGTAISEWSDWRESAPPRAYFMWGARLRTVGEQRDDVARLVVEAKALVDTYLEGSALFAWGERDDDDGYVAIPVPTSGRVMQLDDVLEHMTADIRALVSPGGKAPAPVNPTQRAVDVEDLADDGRSE